MNTELFKRILSSIVLLPISIFVIINGSFYFTLFIMICFIICLYEWNRFNISKIFKIFGIIFLIISFYTIFLIRMNIEDNYWPFLIITIICILTDVGGYVFGKLFKGPKLTVLSPKKTYAGMIGSFTLCAGLYLFLEQFNIVIIENNFIFFVFIFLVSSVSQLGDIFISYFKRLSNIKDTGNIIPGHGGLLDRIDGMIFAFPFSYLLISTDYFASII